MSLERGLAQNPGHIEAAGAAVQTAWDMGGELEDKWLFAYNLTYSDTESLVYDIRHSDVYQWVSENREHFDLSYTRKTELTYATNKKVVDTCTKRNELHDHD